MTDDSAQQPTENTQSAQHYFDLGNQALKTGRYDEAIQHFTGAIELNPDFAEAYNRRGIAYFGKSYNRRGIACLVKRKGQKLFRILRVQYTKIHITGVFTLFERLHIGI